MADWRGSTEPNDNSIAPLLLSASPELRSRDAKAARASVPCADSARKKMSARYQSTDAIRGSTADELTCRLERLSVDLIQRSNGSSSRTVAQALAGHGHDGRFRHSLDHESGLSGGRGGRLEQPTGTRRARYIIDLPKQRPSSLRVEPAFVEQLKLLYDALAEGNSAA